MRTHRCGNKDGRRMSQDCLVPSIQATHSDDGGVCVCVVGVKGSH